MLECKLLDGFIKSSLASFMSQQLVDQALDTEH